MPIAITDSLIPNKAGAPVDARSVVSVLADLANIENPFVGLKVYVTETGKEYRVTALKEVEVGPFVKQQIDTYEDLDAKAAATAMEAVAGAVGELQTAMNGKLDAVTAEAFADEVRATAEQMSAAIASKVSGGRGNVLGGYGTEVLAYSGTVTVNEGATHTAFALFLDPAGDAVDWDKFVAGNKIYLNLENEADLSETDGEGAPRTPDDLLWQERTIAAVDSTAGVIYLDATPINDNTGSSPVIGWTQITASGYASGTYNGATAYRVTVSGAATNSELYAGRAVKILPSLTAPEAIESQTILAVVGNYVWFSSAITAAKIAAILIPPSHTICQVADADREDNAAADGDKNFVTGDRASASGSWNTVSGLASRAVGVRNIVSGDIAFACGTNNIAAGENTFVVGNGNEVTEFGSMAIGNSNKSRGQGQFILGGLNEVNGINAIVVGNSNKATGYGAVVFGDVCEANAASSVALGYRLINNAKESVLIGRHGTFDNSPENEGAVGIAGGTLEEKKLGLVHRIHKKVLNPLYNPALDPTGTGTDSAGEKQYVAEQAFSTEYRGRLSPVTRTVTVTAGATVYLDHDQFARWILSGSGAVTLALENWIDGDRGEVIVNTTTQTIGFPESWIIPEDFNIMTTPGVYLLEIRKESGGVHLHKLLPFGGSGTGSASEIVIGENNHWFVDGVDTGIPATGTVEITQILTGAAGSSATLTEASGSTASARKYTLTVPRGNVGQAAGFGTPSATASTLAPGSSATVSVSASGSDTAKVFSFTFGVPKGDKTIVTINGNGNWFIDGVDSGVPTTGTVEITQVLTGEAGSSAALEEASGSTVSARKYTLTVPRGAQGNPGYGSTNWVTLTYAASVSLSGADGENQRIVLTGDINLTAPTLSAAYPTLLLQIATGGYAVTLGGTTLIESGSSLTYLIGWYFDGESTKRLSVSEVMS